MQKHATITPTLSTTRYDVRWTKLNMQLNISKRLPGLYRADTTLHRNSTIFDQPPRRRIICGSIPGIKIAPIEKHDRIGWRRAVNHTSDQRRHRFINFTSVISLRKS
jgi:hypothetical protein